jgi:FAD/FMN-containing dehydrogenase
MTDQLLHTTTLREGFDGEVLTPGDTGYDEARRVFNGMVDRRPRVIARCSSTADVVAAVGFAREHDLTIAVRGGGHSVAGLGTCDDGLVIDLCGLRHVDVDPAARRVRAGGGVLWGELDAATQAHGLHTPGGRVTTTGVGGFTTGGGYGWTSCRYGLACDNLVRAEVVLADGSVVIAGEGEHSDLLWGLRGGGGNFGVVTELELRLHPLGPMVLAGLLLWPFERAAEISRAWRDLADAAPDELGTACVVMTAPPEPFVPEPLRGRPAVAVAVIVAGDPGTGGALVQPLRDLAPATDLVGEMPYTAFQGLLDASAPHGLRSYWRGEFLDELGDAALDAFVAGGRDLAERGAPLSQAVMFRVGQAIAAVPEEATAMSQRGARYLFHPIVMWEDAADDERMIASGRAFAETMRRWGTGAAYLNFTPEEDRVGDAFGAAKLGRLVALKDRYDPENRFRLNHNIAPSAGVPIERR